MAGLGPVTGPRRDGQGAVLGFVRLAAGPGAATIAEFVRHDTIENLGLKYTEIRNRYETMTRVRLGGRK